MENFRKIKVEHQHELRLAVVFGGFSFPIGFLIASAAVAGWGWTPGLPGMLAGILMGTIGIILGSIIGGKLDRASEKRARERYTKPSSTGREHSTW